MGPQVAFGDGFATLFDLNAYHTALGTVFGHPLPFHNWGYPLFTPLDARSPIVAVAVREVLEALQKASPDPRKATLAAPDAARNGG